MMGYWGFPGLGWGWMGWFFMGPFWLLAMGLVVWGVVSFFSREAPKPPAQTPLEVLKMRYAKGEISEEEYERARQKLL